MGDRIVSVPSDYEIVIPVSVIPEEGDTVEDLIAVVDSVASGWLDDLNLKYAVRVMRTE